MVVHLFEYTDCHGCVYESHENTHPTVWPTHLFYMRLWRLMYILYGRWVGNYIDCIDGVKSWWWGIWIKPPSRHGVQSPASDTLPYGHRICGVLLWLICILYEWNGVGNRESSTDGLEPWWCIDTLITTAVCAVQSYEATTLPPALWAKDIKQKSFIWTSTELTMLLYAVY